MIDFDVYGLESLVWVYATQEGIITPNTWEKIISKSVKKTWKIKRVSGNASAFQTCVYVKKTFDANKCVANFTVKCYDNYEVSIQEAKEKYDKVQ